MEHANPYYFELGWKQISNETSYAVELPNLETQWISSGSRSELRLTPITLSWTNNQNIKFKIQYIEIDENYLFDVISNN